MNYTYHITETFGWRRSTYVLLHIEPWLNGAWWFMKALANVDTLLQTHCCRHKCFPVCPRAQHLLRTQILCPGHKKCFWFCWETFCVRNSLRSPRNTMGNSVSATMCPRLPGPWDLSIILSWTITRGVKRENYHPLSWRIWASLIWIIADDSWRFNGSAFYSWSVLIKDFIACVVCHEQFIPASCKFSFE